MSKSNNSQFYNFDISHIYYDSPEKLGDNIFVADLKTKKKLVFETPVMNIFGDPTETQENILDLNLQFSVNDEKFYNFMKIIDDYNINYIYNHSSKWFDTHFTKEVIHEFYDSCIHNWLDKKKNLEIPYIKLQVPVVHSKSSVKIYKDHKLVSFESLKNHQNVSCCIELTGLRFLKQRLITDWKVREIHIQASGRVNLTNHLMQNNMLSSSKVIDEEMLKELACSQSSSDKTDNNVDMVIGHSQKESTDREQETQDISSQEVEEEEEEREVLQNDNYKEDIQQGSGSLSISKSKFTSQCYNQESQSKSESFQTDNMECNAESSSDFGNKQDLNDSDDIISNIKIKKHELDQILIDATEANRLVDSLHKKAKDTATEIEILSRSLNI